MLSGVFPAGHDCRVAKEQVLTPHATRDVWLTFGDATIGTATLVFASIATPILAGLLMLGAVVLVLVDWAAQP